MSFRPLKIIQRLQSKGFNRSQSEGFIEAMENLVTKEFLKIEIAHLETRIMGKIAELKSELKSEIGALKWMMGAQFTFMGIILTILSLLVSLVYFFPKK